MMMGITYWTLMNSAAGTWCAGATTGTARGRTPGTAMLTCCWRWRTLQRRCRHDPLKQSTKRLGVVSLLLAMGLDLLYTSSMERNPLGQFVRGTNGTVFEGFGVYQDSKG